MVLTCNDNNVIDTYGDQSSNVHLEFMAPLLVAEVQQQVSDSMPHSSATLFEISAQSSVEEVRTCTPVAGSPALADWS